jgi:hypothetical protein
VTVGECTQDLTSSKRYDAGAPVGETLTGEPRARGCGSGRSVDVTSDGQGQEHGPALAIHPDLTHQAAQRRRPGADPHQVALEAEPAALPDAALDLQLRIAGAVRSSRVRGGSSPAAVFALASRPGHASTSTTISQSTRSSSSATAEPTFRTSTRS